KSEGSIYLESVYKVSSFVIPAEAGIQNPLKTLDSRFHGNDGERQIRHLWTSTTYNRLIRLAI
ncbi:MAG: hypothetical protein MUO28_07265, partial [Desulfobacterales bacterium]|nr:hypothetical protein [Desulfobacterales bacterium]